MLLSLFKPMSVAEKKKNKYKPYKRKLVICHPDLTQHKIFRTRGHICTAEKGKKTTRKWNRNFNANNAIPTGHFRVPPGLCFKTRVGAQPLIWKSFFILAQIKFIFTRKVVHLASFWKWRFLDLGSGLYYLRSNKGAIHLDKNSLVKVI